MLSIDSSDAWRSAYPGAAIGLLELSEVQNSGSSAGLEARKRALEAQLRQAYQGYDREAFLAIPILAAYKQYYRAFKKTYHIQLQIESIVLREKRLPAVSPLVDANFIAEMETFVLTAGHDVDKLQPPVGMDISGEGEQIAQMGGGPKAIRAGDMIMRDAHGISCSVIYGQDDRSPITPATSHVLYVSYAPPGVDHDSVSAQLNAIEEYVRLFAPSAVVEQRRLLVAN
jgi:DNA/RNA-binding domain of Phe-tRNA-synthetase-like protein